MALCGNGNVGAGLGVLNRGIFGWGLDGFGELGGMVMPVGRGGMDYGFDGDGVWTIVSVIFLRQHDC